jgi:hypothetical protein
MNRPTSAIDAVLAAIVGGPIPEPPMRAVQADDDEVTPRRHDAGDLGHPGQRGRAKRRERRRVRRGGQ